MVSFSASGSYWKCLPFVMLPLGFSYIALIVLRNVPSVPSLLKVFFFFMKECFILLNAFSVSVGIIMWILMFSLLM